MKILFCLLALLSASLAQASGGNYDDEPQPGENFSHFFQRITRGGMFQGIRIEAPDAFQKAFLPRIYRPSWQGPVNKVRADLEKQGVSLWFDWYKATKPLPILAPTPDSEALFSAALNQEEQTGGYCKRSCRAYGELKQADWSTFTTEERRAFAWSFITKVKFFGGRTLVDFLADQHGVNATAAVARADLMLLNSADFEKAVRRVGWDGPIYFRGITAPSPDDPNRFWILLNDDLMRKMTPFDRVLLQSLDYVGIIAHELGHVLQNMAAEKLGVELNIMSAEAAMMVEGEAEFLNERGLMLAGEAQPFPSALRLFAAEQGVEVVNRPGQSTQGNLFPYTIGVPFAAAAFDMASPAKFELARTEMLKMVAGKITLAEMLSHLLP
ncbi:MAG TPA: hypothetical protein VIH99_03805 [Bdellovibrionota bacterium]|jgi:hypothetical protein